MPKKKHNGGRPREISTDEVVAAVNETRSCGLAAEKLGISRPSVYVVLEREGLALVRERCGECGRLRRGKVVAKQPPRVVRSGAK